MVNCNKCFQILQQINGGSRIFERGFQLFTKTPAQFELKTKRGHQPLTLHYNCIVSNKTTVIRVSQSDCSIRVFKLLGLKSISKEEILKPLWICHYK